MIHTHNDTHIFLYEEINGRVVLASERIKCNDAAPKNVPLIFVIIHVNPLL